jgi:parallel beta-helix repeat protein
VINHQARDFRAHLHHWRQVSFVLFDLGAMNFLAGVGVTFFHSNPLALLGFTSRSLWLGFFFVLGGLLSWKVRRLPAIVPLLIIIGDLWNTIKILPLYERAGYVVLVQSSFVLPLLFILISILRDRLKRPGSASPHPPSVDASAAIHSSNEALALLSSMFVSVGMGLTVLLFFSYYCVNQLAGATNPFINMFHDFLLVPALLLCFPLGAALGEFVWLQGSRLFLRGLQPADFVRYLKQIPLAGRLVEQMLERDVGPTANVTTNRVNFQPEAFIIKPSRIQPKRWRLLWLAGPLLLSMAAIVALMLFIGLPARLDFSRRVDATEETPATPDMLVVSQSGRGEYETIAAALADVQPGETILVRAGVYHENISVDKPVTLIGDQKAQGRVVLECSKDICLTVTADASVRNLMVNARVGFWARFINKVEAHAIAIFRGRPILENVDVSSNTGAGIAVKGSNAEPEIRKARVHDCGLNGFYFTDQSRGLVSDSDVYRTGWAGIRSDHGSKPIVRRTLIHQSRMDGVVVRDQGAATFEDCEIFENANSGIQVKDASSVTVNRSKVFNHKNGGVFIHDPGSVGRLEECEIISNAYSGIEIADHANALVLKSKVHHGKSVGLTIWRQGSATVEESLIFENDSMGMLMVGAKQAVVRKSVFRANAYWGIQVESGSDPLIEECQIYGGRGGGLMFYNGAKGRVTDCAVFGHMNANVVIMTGSNPQIHKSRFSESGQAGLLVQEGGLGVIDDCTISNNYVGVEVKGNSAPIIQHCQVNANRSQGLTAETASAGSITGSDLTRNSSGPWKIENGSHLIRDQNRE